MKNSFQTLSKLQELDNQREELNAKRDKWIFAYFLIPILNIIGIAFTGILPLIVFVTVLSIALSRIIFNINFIKPFRVLTENVKEALLEEFMGIYHPTISHTYCGKDYKASSIIKQSNLISADRYVEEDAISGTKGGNQFYLSEIDLQTEHRNDDHTSYRTIFKGLLFRIKLKGRSFPKSQLYSQPNMFKRWFGTINKNEEFGFWYETQDENIFQKEMQSLFPFISHLAKNGEVRISVQEDEITILMESKMKFLDDPVFSINKSFENESYYAKMSQQMNSLLYIIDSFTDELTPIEIEEKLKLRVFEYADKKQAN